MASAGFLAPRWRKLPSVAAGLALLAAGLAFAQTGGNPDYAGFSSDSQRWPRAPRGLMFFPPIPPPLDRPVPRATRTSGRNGAPPELAPFVCDVFYPQLASRVHGDTLTARQRDEVDDYRALKSALQQELRRELDRLQGADAATRQPALQDLARRQAARLAQLEESAERLRRTLEESERNWSDFREWHLSDKEQRGFSPAEVAQVMRGYAYFQNSLLPAQRRLLIEIALELVAAVDDPAKASRTQPYFFFSPEPARVLLPDNLAPEVAAKVGAYQAKKSALKKQLFDVISAHDGSTFAFLRNTIKSLADQQAPKLAELEALADDIRRQMVQQPAPAPPPVRSPLPPALMVRIGTLLRERMEAQGAAEAKIDVVLGRRDELRVRGAYEFTDEGLKFTVLPLGGGRRKPTDLEARAVKQVTAELTAIAETYGRRLAELYTERDAIRAEAGTILGTKAGAAIDTAMNTAAKILQQQENAGAYADYRTAVFEPGLSIQQRRLLFDAAVQRLELPLPRGEYQPSRRAAQW